MDANSQSYYQVGGRQKLTGIGTTYKLQPDTEDRRLFILTWQPENTTRTKDKKTTSQADVETRVTVVWTGGIGE